MPQGFVLQADGSYALQTTGVGGSGALVPAGNGSAANLTGAGVFTGTAVNFAQYGSATISVFANQNSATNGLSIQQSIDNVNWDFVDQYTVTANAPLKVNVPRQGNWIRVVYTNGATPTTAFRLVTFLNTQMPVSSSVRPQDGLSTENDASETIAFNTTFDANGTWSLMRSIVGANNTQGLGTQAIGEPLWSTTDTTQAAITFSASGDNTIVAAVASQTTRIYRLYIVVAGATNVTFKNGAGTSLSGAIPLAANGAVSLTFSGRPYFKTSANTAFIINSSAAVQVSGWLDYVQSV